MSILCLEQKPLISPFLYFLTSVLTANKLYSCLSQEASPRRKRGAVSWQLAHYSILLEAAELIIMAFNLKHGQCPAWLPPRWLRCKAFTSSQRGQLASLVQLPLWNISSWRGKKKTMRKEQVLAENPNKTICT